MSKLNKDVEIQDRDICACFVPDSICKHCQEEEEWAEERWYDLSKALLKVRETLRYHYEFNMRMKGTPCQCKFCEISKPIVESID